MVKHLEYGGDLVVKKDWRKHISSELQEGMYTETCSLYLCEYVNHWLCILEHVHP